MRFIKNKKIKQLLVNLLDKTVDVAEGFLNAAFTVKHGRLAFNPFYEEMCADHERVYLEYLKKQQLLRQEPGPSTHEAIYCMNDDAACIASLEKMRIIIKQPLKWDGKWRAVAFDIPENRKTVRLFLRRCLHELGFCCFQRSIWITPYDIKKYLQIFIIAAKLYRWVHILEIENISPKHTKLLRHFNLK